jgi:hypothetical protein
MLLTSPNHYHIIMKRLLLTLCLACLTQFASAQNEPAASGDENGFTGKVLETMTTAGYTYVLVDTGTHTNWAAATEFPVKVGDTVTVAAGAPMSNYHSKTLNRDFAVVYFTGSITVAGSDAASAAPKLPPGHPPIGGDQATPALPPGHPALPATQPAQGLPPGHPSVTGKTAAPNLDLTGIKRAKDGKTVKEIVDARKKLSGKPVVVRGKVVKYNAGIMGKNWLHIRDGSGTEEKNNHDITVTTANAVSLGDIVLVKGTVSTDKDFGAGYRYEVIIEDAAVTVE